jgi:hypothetical protein
MDRNAGAKGLPLGSAFADRPEASASLDEDAALRMAARLGRTSCSLSSSAASLPDALQSQWVTVAARRSPLQSLIFEVICDVHCACPIGRFASPILIERILNRPNEHLVHVLLRCNGRALGAKGKRTQANSGASARKQLDSFANRWLKCAAAGCGHTSSSRNVLNRSAEFKT